MFDKPTISLEGARAAVDAALAEASKKPECPVSIAVVDGGGELVCSARMDGAYPLFMRVALNKAYTAAILLKDTTEFAKRSSDMNVDVSSWGDPRLTFIEGGFTIMKPSEGYIPASTTKGTVIGGIGVSGRAAVEDAVIARAGLKAIKM